AGARTPAGLLGAAHGGTPAAAAFEAEVLRPGANPQGWLLPSAATSRQAREGLRWTRTNKPARPTTAREIPAAAKRFHFNFLVRRHGED
ncbi:unnamed protein product, partial [Urochloa humidicola]